MTAVFWICVFLIVYAYGGYTLWILSLSLWVNRPVKKDESYEPEVTFLITAYNEERSIATKLDNTLQLDYPHDRLQIIVASDGSTDRTDDIVREYARQHEIITLVRVEGRVGKTETQNQAVQQARGTVVIFSDATTEYRRDAIRMLVRNYADPGVGAVSGKYNYRSAKRSAMGLATILFWRFENLIKSRQTRIRTITGCCGCIYSVRRDLYEPLPPTIISDLVEPLTIVAKGYRIVFEGEAVAFEDTTEQVPEEFKMRVRVITRGMNGLLYMRRLLNPLRHPFVAFQLLSHKVLRWLVPLVLIVLFAVSVALKDRNWIYGVAFWGQAAFYGMSLVGLLFELAGRKAKALSLPLYFCVVNLASLVSLFGVLRGETKAIWDTGRN